jgi:formylmethanofuran dehydrogenase subunit A
MSGPDRLRITGGAVYDPANGVDGEVRDVCIEGGRIVERLPAGVPALDARGMVVMPGGVDIHSHFASSSCNHARRLIPDEHAADPARAPRLSEGELPPRSGTGGSVPSTFTTGNRYAGLGYTTAFDSAEAPHLARHTHEELRDTPIVDKACCVLMANNEILLDLIERGELERAKHVAAWNVWAAKAYGVKAVNTGGVAAWKWGKDAKGLFEPVPGYRSVTPAQIIAALAGIVDDLGLPHPVHVHCNNLGVAGNYRTTLDTLRTLDGHRAHLAHIQFHAYGGRAGGRPRSRAPELAEYLGAHPEFSADVGQVMFGPATTMTADAPVSAVLSEITHGRWVNADTEADRIVDQSSPP